LFFFSFVIYLFFCYIFFVGLFVFFLVFLVGGVGGGSLSLLGILIFHLPNPTNVFLPHSYHSLTHIHPNTPLRMGPLGFYASSTCDVINGGEHGYALE